MPLVQCLGPAGFVLNDADCDDDDAELNPNTWWYYDADGDSFGSADDGLQQCLQPPSHVRNNWDCDDGDASVVPDSWWYADLDGDRRLEVVFGSLDYDIYCLDATGQEHWRFSTEN